jgi:putative glutamine amidotransferase
MLSAPPAPPIGIFGPDDSFEGERHGCGLWASGYSAALTQAGASPISLLVRLANRVNYDNALQDVQGILLTGNESLSGRHIQEAERLCQWCRKKGMPLMGIDMGMHIINNTFGGSVYTDLPRELPEALQHRHPPERGLRHAIEVVPDTRLAGLYGEGEVVVNSEHRRAVQRLARGFMVSARALDGVVEAIETENPDWFALGVQWHPASSTASGLDIQLFRGLVEASREMAGELVAA